MEVGSGGAVRRAGEQGGREVMADRWGRRPFGAGAAAAVGARRWPWAQLRRWPAGRRRRSWTPTSTCGTTPACASPGSTPTRCSTGPTCRRTTPSTPPAPAPRPWSTWRWRWRLPTRRWSRTGCWRGRAWTRASREWWSGPRWSSGSSPGPTWRPWWPKGPWSRACAGAWATTPPWPPARTSCGGCSSWAEHGLSFDLLGRGEPVMAAAIELVRRCPGTQFMVDHLFNPDVRQGTMDPWRGQLAALAAFPNVSCKVSGVVTNADHEGWRPADLAPYVDHALARLRRGPRGVRQRLAGHPAGRDHPALGGRPGRHRRPASRPPRGASCSARTPGASTASKAPDRRLGAAAMESAAGRPHLLPRARSARRRRSS